MLASMYLLSICYVVGTFVTTEDTAIERKSPHLVVFTFNREKEHLGQCGVQVWQQSEKEQRAVATRVPRRSLVNSSASYSRLIQLPLYILGLFGL